MAALLFALFHVVICLISSYGLYIVFRKKIISYISAVVMLTVPLGVFAMKFAWNINSILRLRNACIWGYVYYGFVIYFSICVACLWILNKCFNRLNFRVSLSVAIFFVLSLLGYGYHNVTTIELTKIILPSNVNARIVFMSDIHAGAINTVQNLKQISSCVDKIKPDLILLGGDTLDLDVFYRYNKTFVNIFKRITNKYKTYAIVGNHEVYAGINRCKKLLEASGIKLLCDEDVKSNGLTIIGRLDYSIHNRKKLDELINANQNNVIVVDHNPVELNYQKNLPSNILLYICGHTHGGQVFPMNVLANYMYKPTGILGKLGESNYYISFGEGFWGIPYRIGTKSEIVLIELKKNK